MKYNIREIASIIGAKYDILEEGSIDHLLTDSRTLSFPETTLFFAIRTQTGDGSRYIAELYRLRVRHFVVNRYRPEFAEMKDANFLIVENVLAALQQLAIHHRKQFGIPVIGITGSNGKTVVKELLYQLLHREFNIVRSPRSYNSQLGVPLSVWQMNGNHTLGIFEAGISQPNEMTNLRRIIAPTIGILTNIGEAHQENFASPMQKCLEKLSLFNNCEVIIYNADDRQIVHGLEKACLSHRGLGWSRTDSEAQIFIESIRQRDTVTEISCTMFGGITRTYVIPFTDAASIENVIHCIALMIYLKPTALGNLQAFRELEPVAMRLEVKDGINHCCLISDTCNSDIHSLAIALDFQFSRKGDRNMKTTVILSDILQSGLMPKVLYKKVAELFRQKKVERVIGIGRDLKTHGPAAFHMESEFYESTQEFIRSSSFRQFGNELILLKGSQMFHFEQITELLEKKVHETILEVNLDAVVHNYNHFRSMLRPQTQIVCMVKAFGYGVGSYELAKTLQEHRCDYLAVAVADEGAELRKEGISIPIIVMNPEFGSFNTLFEYRLEPEVYSFRLLNALIREAERRGIVSWPVHVKIDTGMYRLGFRPEDMPEVCRQLKQQNGLYARSVFSHLAGSDSAEHDAFTLRQIQAYTRAADTLEKELGYPVARHVLNSAGIERFTACQFNMVRLGIGLYGISALAGSEALQPVCALKTTILQIQDVPAGRSVGYGRKSRTERDSRIAVIPIGYADGLDRRLGNGAGEVVIRGRRCPFIGNLCMDISMIDVTDVEAQERDEVTVFGKTLSVSEIARKLNTIPYEILTSISPRVKRIYYKE
ncbi:MAG: bifunctional UDP-N-acetylmuramoyl-tripeptide:D-alanyl-D-alanine ligase/alanine racemase [Tannerella sp.]|jgi:alanine racemase|nr:bifunctional UDP-N-acetylmuramoyl-tripeptide:D-alanyl-D-alanine ligase/alanine racemase [Tannerella sp.]